MHRILAIEEQDGTRHYTTQGDANKAPDHTQITLATTAWRVWYSVPFAGYLIYAFTQPAGALLMVVVPLIGLALLTVWDRIKKSQLQPMLLRVLKR